MIGAGTVERLFAQAIKKAPTESGLQVIVAFQRGKSGPHSEGGPGK